MKNKKVVLAMSGGVDSSVAALLLQKKGYEVHAFFMNCSPSDNPKWPSSISWKEEERNVREICKKLNITDVFVKDCEQGYEEKVIKPMFEAYEKGFTPNPDILCNNIGKFPGLLKRAHEIGADFIATGHYAKVKKEKNGYALYQAKDKHKDQSYFLLGLNQTFLAKTIFPLQNLTKEKVREIARQNDFENANKRSSRGVCYLGKIDMKAFLKERIKPQTGNVLSPEKKVIGTHPGAAYFTIGERIGDKKGFTLNKEYRKINPSKLYVAKKTPRNQIIIAPENHQILKTKKIAIKNLALINPKDFPKTNLKARIRHVGNLIPGKIIQQRASNRIGAQTQKDWRRGEGGNRAGSAMIVGNPSPQKSKWIFICNKSQEGVAQGQLIALYQKEKLIGGGEIRLH